MSLQSLSVLLIDDDPDYGQILKRQLSGLPDLQVELVHASTPVEGLGAIHRDDPDVVLLEYQLERGNGIDVLRGLRRAGDERALLIITGDGNDTLAARCIREGADDYLSKQDLSVDILQRAIANARGQVERRRLQKQLELTARQLADANRALELLAREDELTGLCTRRYWNERLEQELVRVRRFAQPLCFLFIDVDHFKRINDRHGHAVGDRVLAAVGHTVRRELRKSDLAGRYGGDEICAYLTQTPIEGACIFAERLLASIREIQIELPDGEALSVTASIGVAAAERPEDGLDALLERADNALYQAKAAGRDCVAAAESTPLPARPEAARGD